MEGKKEVDLISCGCGCGELRPRFDKKGIERFYINGHYKESRFKLGFKHTEESKKKMSEHRSGKNHGMWKGGRYIAAKGYYYKHKPEHHFATKDGYVMEHRLVWEEHNNAVLLKCADVHHINGNKLDNRIENLEAMMHGKHTTLTNKGVRHGFRSDVVNRLCYQCNRHTYFDKRKGYFMWYKDSNGNYICRKCARSKWK